MSDLSTEQAPAIRDFLLSSKEELPPARLTIRQVMDYICSKYKLTIEELRGPQRNNRVARPRAEGYWLCSKFCDASLPKIGRAFGGRDHTTIMHGISRHEQRMREELELLGEGHE